MSDYRESPDFILNFRDGLHHAVVTSGILNNTDLFDDDTCPQGFLCVEHIPRRILTRISTVLNRHSSSAGTGRRRTASLQQPEARQDKGH